MMKTIIVVGDEAYPVPHIYNLKGDSTNDLHEAAAIVVELPNGCFEATHQFYPCQLQRVQ